MKTYIFYLYLFLFQGMLAAFAQVFPFISDPGSNEGSLEAIPLYTSTTVAENRVTVGVNQLSRVYLKREKYMAGAALVMAKITEDTGEAYNRYLDLKRRNNALTLFSYSTKKENTRALETIEKMLNNLLVELAQQSPHVLLGEKVNLYVNTMESLLKIHRLMDEVEDRINNTSLFRRLFY